MSGQSKLSIAEVFGLTPIGLTLAQAKMVFRGDPTVPPARFDHTSLSMATPRLSLATWRGRRAAGRQIPILNLFNHTPTPVEDGWSVRFTQVRDFRGGRLTYDSHNGTDFVIPPGTVTVAAAAGRVVSIRREWNRGGLKVYLDHGGGLFTTHNHLGRALVRVGEVVKRAQPVALTAYSGIDGFVGFPWLAPHVHYNVILGGVLVDPFGAGPAAAGPSATGEQAVPLWRDGNQPRPAKPDDELLATPPLDPARVSRLLADLIDPARRSAIAAMRDPAAQAAELIIEATVYPTRFRTPEAGRLLYEAAPPRIPHLSLPFQSQDFDSVAFADDLGYR